MDARSLGSRIGYGHLNLHLHLPTRGTVVEVKIEWREVLVSFVKLRVVGGLDAFTSSLVIAIVNRFLVIDLSVAKIVRNSDDHVYFAS